MLWKNASSFNLRLNSVKSVSVENGNSSMHGSSTSSILEDRRTVSIKYLISVDITSSLVRALVTKPANKTKF